MRVCETDRLVLRRLCLDDADFILKLLNDPAWIDNIGDKNVHSLDDARHYLDNGPLAMYQRYGFGLFLVETKAGGVPIGLCGLIRRDGLADVDLGFALLPAYRGQGYAFEAAVATIEYGQSEHALPSMVAITLERNSSCITLLTRLGFTFKEAITLEGDTEELHLYTLTLREY